MEEKIAAFGQMVDADAKTILSGATNVLQCLRIDLEPRFYERLQTRAESFLSNELNDAFLKLMQREDGPT